VELELGRIGLESLVRSRADAKEEPEAWHKVLLVLKAEIVYEEGASQGRQIVVVILNHEKLVGRSILKESCKL
jgi:hypothetical protein